MFSFRTLNQLDRTYLSIFSWRIPSFSDALGNEYFLVVSQFAAILEVTGNRYYTRKKVFLIFWNRFKAWLISDVHVICELSESQVGGELWRPVIMVSAINRKSLFQAIAVSSVHSLWSSALILSISAACMAFVKWIKNKSYEAPKSVHEKWNLRYKLY